ncbi:MAG TPA: hypothetical protein VFN75_05440 [Pseudonocardiaceae bacterium]|nr:hypothetical protein [Pseudonocardiaceae bacterium]
MAALPRLGDVRHRWEYCWPAERGARTGRCGKVRDTLTDVLMAECSDLAECSGPPGCPIPFADLD